MLKVVFHLLQSIYYFEIELMNGQYTNFKYTIKRGWFLQYIFKVLLRQAQQLLMLEGLIPKLRRQTLKLLLKTAGKIRKIGKTNLVGNFRNIAHIVFNQLCGTF